MAKQYWTNGEVSLHQGDARDMSMIEDGNVHCVVTSPPYWGLRDYGVSDGIGLEATVGEFVKNIVSVGREVSRVLRNDGTFWLNLGDSYHLKSLVGQPWRVAFALKDDGWKLRSAIVWHKPNPMPESVKDRPTGAHEMIFLLTKRPRYFYDAEAIKTDSKDPGDNRKARSKSGQKRLPTEMISGLRPDSKTYPKANARNVWRFPTQPRPDAHFATFPDELPRRCIMAGTSEHGVCSECGAPYVRKVERKSEPSVTPRERGTDKQSGHGRRHAGFNDRWEASENDSRQPVSVGWRASCKHEDAPVVPAVVLDPFVGSGTTAAVAQSLGRHAIGLDMNEEYLEIARHRVESFNHA